MSEAEGRANDNPGGAGGLGPPHEAERAKSCNDERVTHTSGAGGGVRARMSEAGGGANAGARAKRALNPKP